MNITRRMSLASIAGIAAGIIGTTKVKAQEQIVDTGLQIVSTGDVFADQAVGASQSVIIRDQQGNIVRGAGQTVVTDSQIVSTEDVVFSQAVGADQTLVTDSGYAVDGCIPGAVWADPANGVLYYCDDYCNWMLVPCCEVHAECRGRCR